MLTITELCNKHYSKIDKLDFDLLLAHSLKKPREFIFTYPNNKLNWLQRLKLAYFLFLYRRGYSVAAIIKHKEFFGLDFYVNKHVLIPRPETELLVKKAIGEIKKTRKPENQKTILIDVGTGTGCIPIAINKSRNQEIKKTIAIDISKQALRVAKKNAGRHNVDITFLHGNLLEPFMSLRGARLGERRSNPPSLTSLVDNNGIAALGRTSLARNDMLIITANLPYLTEQQFTSSPSIQKEPRSALVADSINGLSLYDQLLAQIKLLTLDSGLWTLDDNGQRLKSKVQSLTVLLEIDPSQTPAITALIKKHLPQASIEIKKDLAGLDRVVKISV